jgi:hypothetical protein
MLIQKLNVELILVADEADPAVAELNAALDRMEEDIRSSAGQSRPSLSSTLDHGSDRPSRIRWPQVSRLQARSGLHVGA